MTKIIEYVPFADAVTIYHGILERIKSLEGSLPNVPLELIRVKECPECFNDVSRSLCIGELTRLQNEDGHITAYVPFLHYILVRGKTAGEYCLLEPDLFQEDPRRMTVVCRQTVSDTATLQECMKTMFQRILHEVLFPIAKGYMDHVDCVSFRVVVGGEYGTEHSDNYCETWSEAMELLEKGRQKQSGLKIYYHTGCMISALGIGRFIFPALGEPFFVPEEIGTEEVIAAANNDDLLMQYTKRKRDIELHWSYILVRAEEAENYGFVFNTVQYMISPDMLNNEPILTCILRMDGEHLVFVSLQEAYQSGLLAAWSQWLGFDQISN